MRVKWVIILGITAVMQVPINTPSFAADSQLKFAGGGTNEFVFDTGVLSGKLRADGRSKGLTSVRHVPSGRTFDRGMGLFGHYRVFSANKRYGTAAWDWPSEAKLLSDGSVEVRWPSVEERPFELRAIYRWAAPNTLDVETSVHARTNLAKFESFLASYFAEGFSNSLAYVANLPDKPGSPGFLAASQSFGTWLTFPREDAVWTTVRDGRWTFPPSPVDWVKMPRLARPLGVRRDPATGLTAVLMSPPEDCFAISTPFQTEGHYSMYLSLFGRDLKEGETAFARARLVIAEDLSDAEVLQFYERYLKELARR
jgi:hypothetical protein